MRHIGSAEAECCSVESGCRESADVHLGAMRRVGPAAVYGLANPAHPDQRRVMDTLSTLRRRITTGRAVPTASLFAAAVLVVSGCGLTGNRDSTEPGPAGASPTVAPSTGAPSRTTEPTDTRAWTTYTSAEYGFKVGHPADWKEIPATRDWRSDADAEDPLSAAHDAFQSPSDDVRVSVWNVPLDPRTSVGSSTDDLGAWVEEYCARSDNAPCTGINDRAVQLCLEKWDCHPGLLVPFKNDVQAYFSGGIYDGDAMTVVAVWQGESAPPVASYGGSQRLLEAFLSTMQVWPASTPREERQCYGRPPSGLTCQQAG